MDQDTTHNPYINIYTNCNIEGSSSKISSVLLKNWKRELIILVRKLRFYYRHIYNYYFRETFLCFTYFLFCRF